MLVLLQGYIFTWLIGYSALLGPVGGIMLADYFVLRGRKLDVDALYSNEPGRAYWYRSGYNLAALAALVVGVLPSIPGFLQASGFMASVPAIFEGIYSCAWFFGFSLSFCSYLVLSRMGQYNGGEATGIQGPATSPA